MENTFTNSGKIKKIFSFHSTIQNRIISRESGWLEFKESFNWSSKDKYAKSIAAFANNKGGYIAFGIKNEPRELIGLQSGNFETIDEEKITSYFNSVFSPEIKYEKYIDNYFNKKIGFLYVSQAEVKPIICIKNDGQLKESDIYYRYNARSERIKYPELRNLIDSIREIERKSWMEHFQKISKIGPLNAAILDVLGGEISGPGGTLVIDKKLASKLRFIKEGAFEKKGKPVLRLIGDVKPVTVIIGKGGKKSTEDIEVRITENPNAPAIRLEENDLLKKYPLDYKTLTNNLLSRYIDFKRDSKYHKLKKDFKKNKKLSLIRYLDPKNLKSPKKSFYSLAIYKEFDKHYLKIRSKI